MLQPTMRLLFWIAAVVFCKVIEGGSISGEFQYCSIHCADKPNTATKPLKQELKALSKPRDCYDIKFDEPTSTSGVYTVYLPDGHPGGIEVFCDMKTDAGGWLFQKRFDGSVDFFRSWDDYTVGFGNLSTEFWLGLNSIQKLTRTRKFHLRVDLSDFEENTAFAQYSMFQISEGPDFRLSFDQYSGTAGSALEKQKFSTKDKDQDTHASYSCSVRYFGAWWYGACHASNLNGKYLSGTTTEFATGMVWKPWKGYHYSLKTAEMKIRPYYD